MFHYFENMHRDWYLNKICASSLYPNKLRPYLYRLGHVDVGKNVSFCPHVVCGGGTNIHIGDNTFINYNVWIEDNVTIGKNCNITYKVTFCTSSHEIGDSIRRAGKSTIGKISIGDGTWIGANSIILPGVTIGSGCIIGAGSVVTKDCESNKLYAGNPAKIIKDLRYV